MSGTVREIVSFADKSGSSDDERINKALKIACADEFISELENGIDTVLGERGTGLSEGQMQRIAIARAIFSGSPILVLDEATSALDDQTEKKLLENLRALTDKTVIIVTHRAAALEICDRKIDF
jgi:ATP-binding cassette subfamily B protein